MNAPTKVAEACCTTPSAMRFWLEIFFAALAPLIVIAVFWHPLSAAAGAFAAGIACLANWLKNRTYHCGISGPILLAAGAVLLVAAMKLIDVDPAIVWAIAAVGVLVSLFLEWRYAKRPSRTTA